MTIEVRERRREGFTLERLKLETQRAVKPTVVVVAGLCAAALGVAYIATHVSRTLLASTYEVRFAVRDATAVVPGQNQVRIKGVPVGTIQQLDLVGGAPVLTVAIQRKYGRIYRDARAQLRPNTALQDMYLDIVDRGTPRAGRARSGTPIAASRTQTPVNIDDVLNVFRPSVRGQLRALLDNLGNGLDDRGVALKAAFTEIVPLLDRGRAITDQLAERRTATRRLVQNTTLLTTELARRQRQLRELVSSSQTTLGALRDGRDDLDRTLVELPRVVTAVHSAFVATAGVLPDVDRAIGALAPAARDLPQSLAALQQLATTAHPALRDLRPTVRRLAPLTQRLIPVAGGLRASVDALQSQTGTLNHATQALAACKKGVQGFFQWDASMSKFGDSFGPVPRGNVVAGAQTAGGMINNPWEIRPGNCVAGEAIGGRVPRPEDEH